MAALIIALGMLVDNGIVMSENIMVQMEKGKSATQAALDSAAELRVALLTASLFKVVTITLLCSWIISLTVIPMFCVYFLKVTPRQEDFSSGFYALYRRLLTQLLDHRLQWAWQLST
jgi:multidrug efflux pump subunit AcrB